MLCRAKLRGGDAHCQKHGMVNGRCRLHGGLSPKGRDHWNYRHGQATKEYRRNIVEANSRIRLLELIAIELGMIDKAR
jgi:phage gp16-like protein